MKGMRKWKRFLAMLLVALMVSTLVPVDVFAEESGAEVQENQKGQEGQVEEGLEKQRQAQVVADAENSITTINLSELDSDDVDDTIPDEINNDFNKGEKIISDLLSGVDEEWPDCYGGLSVYIDLGTGIVLGYYGYDNDAEISLSPLPSWKEDNEVEGNYELDYFSVCNGIPDLTRNVAYGDGVVVYFFFNKIEEDNEDDTSAKMKEIIIHTKGSGEFVYDGTVHSAGDVDVFDQVIDGRTYRVTGVEAVPVKAQDVGTYVSSFVYSDKGIKVFDVTEDLTGIKYEVTDQFEVILEPSTIVITPRPVEITSYDASKVYDGAVFADKDYQKYTVVKGSIIERDNIQMVFAGSPYAYVGEYENTFSAYSKNEKALENYSFTYNFGKLTIKPSPVTIVSEDAKKVFDGEKFDDNDYQKYTIDGKIAVKDDVQIVFAESPYEVNTYENKFEIYIEDEAARKNYEFTTKFGTLTISPAESKPVVDPINPTPTPNPGPTGGGGGTDTTVTTETVTTPVFPTITNAPVAPAVVNTLNNATPVVAAVANNDQFPMLVVEEPETPENDPAPAAPAVVQIADEETPLANVLLDHDHLDCILHLLLMLGAMVIFGVYTHNHKKLQSEIQELEEAIEGRKSGKITSARKHVA